MVDLVSFSEILGPFLVVFTISYAILHKIKLFNKKSADTMISLIMALLFIFPHILGTKPDYVPVLNKLMPSVALLLVVFFCFLLIISALGMDINKELFVNLLAGFIFIDLVIPDALIIAWVSRTFGMDLPPWLSFLGTEWFFMMVIFITVMLAVVYFITRD